MSEQRTLLCDTAEAVFAEAATEGMAPIEAAGFGQLLVHEGDGGFGGDWGDAFAVLRLAGAKVPHLPVGELIVGGEISRPIGAFIRVAQAAGAMDAALAMSIDYVNTRQQFGKPLGKFRAAAGAGNFRDRGGRRECRGRCGGGGTRQGRRRCRCGAVRNRLRQIAHQQGDRAGYLNRASGAWRDRLHPGI